MPYAADGQAVAMDEEIVPAVFAADERLKNASWPALWNWMQIGDGLALFAGFVLVGFVR